MRQDGRGEEKGRDPRAESRWKAETRNPRRRRASMAAELGAFLDWLFNSRFVDGQVALDGVEGDAHADREGGVQRDVPEGQTSDDGDFQWEQALFEHILQGLPVFLGVLRLGVMAVGVDTDGDASDLLEQAGVEQLGQHAVKTIGDFVHVLKEEDLVPERGLKGSPEGGAKEGDIAAHQRAGDDAAAQDGDGLLFVTGTNAAWG